jgi:hypothetical protein
VAWHEYLSIEIGEMFDGLVVYEPRSLERASNEILGSMPGAPSRHSPGYQKRYQKLYAEKLKANPVMLAKRREQKAAYQRRRREQQKGEGDSNGER